MYRLLIVDDEPDICENVKYLLDWAGYGFTSIMTATSFPDALSKAVDLQPHVALVDTRLGDRWGYDLVAQLHATGMRTVFCMISGYDDSRYIRRAMQASARDYLLKPLDVGELRAFVERTVVNDLGGTLPERDVVKQELDPVLMTEYSSFSKITNKIILFTKENYRSPVSLTTIADSFHMSSKYIGRIFLRDTGIKFSEYLMSYRMLEARRLITNSQDKISVIADAVGYSQLNNFYIHFKNYFGVSPGALRNFDAPPEAAETASPSQAPLERTAEPSVPAPRGEGGGPC